MESLFPSDNEGLCGCNKLGVPFCCPFKMGLGLLCKKKDFPESGAKDKKEKIGELFLTRRKMA